MCLPHVRAPVLAQAEKGAGTRKLHKPPPEPARLSYKLEWSWQLPLWQAMTEGVAPITGFLGHPWRARGLPAHEQHGTGFPFPCQCVGSVRSALYQEVTGLAWGGCMARHMANQQLLSNPERRSVLRQHSRVLKLSCSGRLGRGDCVLYCQASDRLLYATGVWQQNRAPVFSLRRQRGGSAGHGRCRRGGEPAAQYCANDSASKVLRLRGRGMGFQGFLGCLAILGVGYVTTVRGSNAGCQHAHNPTGHSGYAASPPLTTRTGSAPVVICTTRAGKTC